MNPLMISLVFISFLVKRAMTRESTYGLKDIAFGKPLSMTVLEGNNLSHICPSPGYTPDKVYWENEAKTFHSEGRELNIMNISRNMSGTYTCYGRNDSTTVSLESFDIDVQYPAKILFWNDTQNEVHANDSFVSIASVEGNPAPTIDLISIKQQTVIISKHGEGNINLTFSRVQCEDTGLYELHCSNKYNSDVKSTFLYVLCPPYVSPEANITFDIRPRLGDFARFTMLAAGYPAPSFTWTHDAKEIKHEDNNYTSTVDLTVSSFVEFGEYQLEMQNVVGSVFFTYRLIPAGPPGRPKELQVVSISENSVTLSWISGYDYNNTQTFVVMNIKGDNSTEMQTFDDPSTDSGQKELNGTIRNLKPNSQYNMTMKAVNKDGEAKSDMFVHFVTKDKTYSFPTLIIVSAIVGLCIVIILTLLITYRCRKGKKRYQDLSADNNTDHSQNEMLKPNVTLKYGSTDVETNQQSRESQRFFQNSVVDGSESLEESSNQKPEPSDQNRSYKSKWFICFKNPRRE